MTTLPAINDTTEAKELVTNSTTRVNITPEEKELTDWFFMRLANIYGKQFHNHWGDARGMQLAKREFCKEIGRFTKRQLEQKLVKCKQYIKDDPRGWGFIKMPQILGIPCDTVSPDGRNAAAYLVHDDRDERNRHKAAVDKARSNPEVQKIRNFLKNELFKE